MTGDHGRVLRADLHPHSYRSAGFLLAPDAATEPPQ